MVLFQMEQPTLMFEGVPTYPSASRCWEICDKHDISIFYTAPTAIRALNGSRQ
jgi:acetyl-CoA synthetase